MSTPTRRALPDGAWPNCVLGNHDRPRIATRVGAAQARVAAMLLLTLRGTPTLYYGDEIGMRDVPIPPDRVQDPWELRVPGGPRPRPRAHADAVDGGPNAGFSAGASRGCRSRRTRAAQRRAPARGPAARCSTLYRALLALRRAEHGAAFGDWAPLRAADGVLAYLRGGRFLVALNLTGEPRTLALDGRAGRSPPARARASASPATWRSAPRRRTGHPPRALTAYCRAMRIALLSALALALLLPAAAAAQNPWLDERVLNIAHQGGEDEFPSNTLYAFKRSVKAGADMLELDVGVTKDGAVVVSHDTTLDRTTDGHGRSRRKTLRQIRRLDAAHWFAKGDDAYRHDRPRKAYRFRGIATGDRKPPTGYRAQGLPRPDARRGAARVPAHADQHRDQGPHARRGAGRVRRQRRGARGVLKGPAATTSSSSPSSSPPSTASTRSCRASPSRPGSTARPRTCSAAARPATASSPSSSRSPTRWASRR